jgi:hypothetical protein
VRCLPVKSARSGSVAPPCGAKFGYMKHYAAGVYGCRDGAPFTTTAVVRLIALTVAMLTASSRAFSECFRPRTPEELAAAIEPLGKASSRLRVCLDEIDDECAPFCSCVHSVLFKAQKFRIFS